MRIYFMKQDALEFLKANMESLYPYYFQREDSNWIEEVYGKKAFSFFTDIPDFELAAQEGRAPGEIDLENCKIIYSNLRRLSESQASDERLWAGLCHKTFYSYIRKRYGYINGDLRDKKRDSSAILSRFFFSGGIRSGLYRNVLAKTWWVGYATYDQLNPINRFEKLDILGAADFSSKVSDIFYSNTFAASPVILSGICKAMKFYSDRGIYLSNKDHIRPAVKYLNAVGGVILLDALSDDEICDVIVEKINDLKKGNKGDIEYVETEDAMEIELDEVREGVKDNSTFEFQIVKNEMPLGVTNGAQKKQRVESLDAPKTITYGCTVVLSSIINRDEKKYQIPLKNDTSRNLYMVEKMLLGKKIRDTILVTGKKYSIKEFYWTDM